MRPPFFSRVSCWHADVENRDNILTGSGSIKGWHAAEISIIVLVLMAASSPILAEIRLHQFETVVLTEEFFCEGVCFADIDQDGNNDIVSGPFWYRGPDFDKRIAYSSKIHRHSIKGYSNHFFSFAGDFNQDSWPDILVVGMPGQAAYWYQNPGSSKTVWKKHLALPDVGNESPELVDLTGDGKPELVCCHGGAIGYTRPNANAPDQPWNFIPISDNRGFGAFTHGLGIGDVNGDGLQDVIETNGWWEQTKHAGDLFVFHRYPFSQSGGSQYFAYDFDGDGDNDIVAVQNAHGWGLTWFENLGRENEFAFRPHSILTNNPGDNAYGLAISQMHSLALADIDGDGIKDLVTGKRFWAHGGGDPGAQELPVLYWLKTVRSKKGVYFEPWLISNRVGVGTQLVVGDVNNDKLPDILVGNKLGTFVARNSRSNVSLQTYEDIRPPKKEMPAHVAGTGLFASLVRSTNAISPLEQSRTFVLPPGFKIELVAADPIIGQPMNLAFDRQGQLWVSSSREYPFAARDGEGNDTITVFTDTNNDGSFDKSTTFADKLNIPIGLLPYKDGVICFSIPHIWFLRDTDADGVADQRDVLYGPFDTTRDTHGMCNGFNLGLDGWLYACHGFNNHSTVSGTDGHKISMHSGNTFRMRIDGSRVEHVTHGQVNPFGMTFDRFGDILTADCHTKPISLLIQGGFHESFGKPHDGLGFIPNVMDHLHSSTGIAGIALGRETNFPSIYQSSSFGGNVVTGRINRNTILRRGSTIVAQEEPDFLIPEDPWFRPVDLTVGPDGCLYIADFYNRIIGHYEVDLKHPGRDRRQGRIWKVSYVGTKANRKDTVRKPIDFQPRSTDLISASLDQLILQLDSNSPHHAALVLDQIVANHAAAVESLRTATRHDSARIRKHAAWGLFRLDAISKEDIDRLVADESVEVRTHAFRIVEALPKESLRLAKTPWIQKGLKDDSAMVRRAAALAAAFRVDESLIRPLIDLLVATQNFDGHLRYTVRMALRNHLRHPTWFSNLQHQALSEIDRQVITDLCLALKSQNAADFLVSSLAKKTQTSPVMQVSPNQLRTYLNFASQYASDKTTDQIARIAMDRFPNDLKFQIQLLNAVRIGLQQRGNLKDAPKSIRDWATGIAQQLLGLDAAGNLVDSPQHTIYSWSFEPIPGSKITDNSWTVSSMRNAADGRQGIKLWSSFPKGEPRTGVFRSEPFTLSDEFQFFIAGHDGFPGQSLQGKNVVRLRDANTHQLLFEAPAPRNDTAQKVLWNTNAHQGKNAYLELIDRDTAGAYAWLAVGQFSIPGLNPNERAENIRIGAATVDQFQLTNLHPPLAKLLQSSTDREISKSMANVFANQHGNSLIRVLGECYSIQGIKKNELAPIANLIIQGDADDRVTQFVKKAMGVADTREQQRIAEILTTDSSGAKLLLHSVTDGVAAARLFTVPTIFEKAKTVLSQEDVQSIEKLLASLPKGDARLQKMIDHRIANYLQEHGNAIHGAMLFTKNCATCHRIGKEGKQIGPNLDGIGTRGVSRIVEDILDPHRNVDVAFRSTTVVTTEGKVLNGLLKPQEGGGFLLFDSQAKETILKESDIEERHPSSLSPMPTNVAEILTEEQFRDLVAFLLTVQGS